MKRIANMSVAIATLDRPAGFQRCLDALFAGDMLPAEVIVVDQSADDQTQALIGQASNSAVPLIYIRQQRRGLSLSRNTAVAHGRYPVIAVTDDDCIPSRGWVAAIDRVFSGPNAPAAASGRVLPLGPESPGLYAVSSRSSTVRSAFYRKCSPWLIGTGGNFAMQQSWLAQLGGYDERLGAGSPGKAAEDMDMIYRLLQAGAHIQYDPDMLIYHERQTLTRRVATRASYGYGMGAFCGMWLRSRDPYALRMLAAWILRQCREQLLAVRRRKWMEVCERSLTIQGTARGLLHGLNVKRQG